MSELEYASDIAFRACSGHACSMRYRPCGRCPRCFAGVSCSNNDEHCSAICRTSFRCLTSEASNSKTSYTWSSKNTFCFGAPRVSMWSKMRSNRLSFVFWHSSCFSSAARICSNMAALSATKWRISTKLSMMRTLTSIAVPLHNAADSIEAPCSVNIRGM